MSVCRHQFVAGGPLAPNLKDLFLFVCNMKHAIPSCIALSPLVIYGHTEYWAQSGANGFQLQNKGHLSSYQWLMCVLRRFNMHFTKILWINYASSPHPPLFPLLQRYPSVQIYLAWVVSRGTRLYHCWQRLRTVPCGSGDWSYRIRTHAFISVLHLCYPHDNNDPLKCACGKYTLRTVVQNLRMRSTCAWVQGLASETPPGNETRPAQQRKCLCCDCL